MQKLIILHGAPSAGKTSTLRKLFELLTGYTLRSRGPKGDFRAIFTVGDKTVFLATPGDTAGLINTNFAFFNGKLSGRAYVYELAPDGTLVRADKARVQGLTPDICIMACRVPDGKVNAPYDTVCQQILLQQPIEHGVLWRFKEQATGTRRERKTNNQDYETALALAAEVIREANL